MIDQQNWVIDGDEDGYREGEDGNDSEEIGQGMSIDKEDYFIFDEKECGYDGNVDERY